MGECLAIFNKAQQLSSYRTIQTWSSSYRRVRLIRSTVSNVLAGNIRIDKFHDFTVNFKIAIGQHQFDVGGFNR